MLTLIEWVESLSIGNKNLDDEHKKFIELINDLIKAHNSGCISEKMDAIIGNIIDFAEDHFDHEEDSMRSKRYHGLREQELAHQRLMASMIEIRNEWKAHNSKRSAIDFSILLQGWISNHLIKMDKRYGEFLRAGGNETRSSTK